MIKIYLVDDHPFVREGLKTYLCTFPDIEVAGEASSGEQLLQEIAKIRPDVAVIDLHLPGISGTEVIRCLDRDLPTVRSIILSSFCEEEDILDAVEAGASGYLTKDMHPSLLAEAIRKVAGGERVLNPRIQSRLNERSRLRRQLAESLSAKELEILNDLARGLSNKEIGSLHFISEATVKSHISAILRKLEVHDRTQAAILAIRLRLTEGGPL